MAMHSNNTMSFIKLRLCAPFPYKCNLMDMFRYLVHMQIYFVTKLIKSIFLCQDFTLEYIKKYLPLSFFCIKCLNDFDYSSLGILEQLRFWGSFIVIIIIMLYRNDL